MANQNAGIDDNDEKSLLGVSSADGKSTVAIYADPDLHALYVTISSLAGFTQTDEITATSNGQTVFPTTKDIDGVLVLFISGIFNAPVNYTVQAESITLNSGVPINTQVVVVYFTVP